MKNLPLVLLILGLVLGCGSSPGNGPTSLSSSGNSRANSAGSPTGTPLPTIAISSTDLVKAYKENELAADEKYQGRKLEVSGKISHIATVLGSIQVDLEGKDYTPVKCSFPEERKAEVVKLKTGQRVVVTGTGDGMTSTLYVGLDDCSIKQTL
jgi:hypothetical protein